MLLEVWVIPSEIEFKHASIKHAAYCFPLLNEYSTDLVSPPRVLKPTPLEQISWNWGGWVQVVTEKHQQGTRGCHSGSSPECWDLHCTSCWDSSSPQFRLPRMLSPQALHSYGRTQILPFRFWILLSLPLIFQLSHTSVNHSVTRALSLPVGDFFSSSETLKDTKGGNI